MRVFGWERLSAATAKGRLVFLVMTMAVVTLVAVLELLLIGSPVPLGVAALGWGIILVYGVVDGTLLEPFGRIFGALTVPSGSATPSVNQHSNIGAMVARGRYAEAAAAYRAAIAADPGDVVACEQLARLALGDLKDYELALFAAREGEKRAPDARRRAGFALLAAGICRDNLKDRGRAVVELRRILACYPDVPNAARLRTELEELKAMHFEAP
jgi:tetratricopeptide (TPR) repeat protein